MAGSGDSFRDAVSVFDFERIAATAMERTAWDYYRSGADDELALSRNRTAFEKLVLYYRVLVDVSRIDTSVEVVGTPSSLPILCAPTAFHRLAHDDGEIATAKAAGEAGTIMVLSTLSNTPVEDVVAATTAPVWFQLYVYKDRGMSRALVERAANAGCKALVLTVDAPHLGKRERDVRNQFSLPDGLAIENVLPTGARELPAEAAQSGLAAYFHTLIDPSLSWRDLDWLSSVSELPILIKGVVRADDARRAKDAGCAGVVVSNHGGRQLDSAPATIDALPAIAEAIGDDLTVLLDGGVRRGTDVVKALARGARAVLLGRPILWALAAAASRGSSTCWHCFATSSAARWRCAAARAWPTSIATCSRRSACRQYVTSRSMRPRNCSLPSSTPIVAGSSPGRNWNR